MFEERNMEDVGIEEGENVEVGQEKENLSYTYVHGQVEPNPNPADGVELEAQNSTDGNGVELPSEIQGPVDFDQTVLEGTEDTRIIENSLDELVPGTESDELVSNVDSGVHCDSEIVEKIESEENGGEKEEALKDEIGSEVNPSIELPGCDETDNNVGDGEPSQNEVPMEIENEEHGVEVVKSPSSKTNPSNEPDITDEMDNGVFEMEHGVGKKEPMEIEKEEHGVGEEKSPSSKTNPSNRPDIIDEIDNNVCETEHGVGKQEPMEIEKEEHSVEEEKSPSNNTNPFNEPDITAKTVNGIREMELDMPPASEVPKEKLIDGVSSEAGPSSKTSISAEHDNTVSEVEPGMPCDIEVVTDKHIDAVSNKVKSSIAPDDSMETANVVCEVKPDMSLEVAMGKLINELCSEANTSSEPHISTEPDNAVSKGEPDRPRDSEVAMQKLIDEVSSEANPSSEPHITAETDNDVCKEDLGIPHDSEGITEKVVDGVSSEANPSNEQHISTETENVVYEAEPDKMPHDSGVSKENQIDGLDSKIYPSSDPHISAETDNVVNQVERDMPRDNEVEIETETYDNGQKGIYDNGQKGEALNGGVTRKTMFSVSTDISEKGPKPKFYVGRKAGIKSVDPRPTFLLDPDATEGDESGTEEEQTAFRKEVEKVYKEKYLEFKAPKFYKEELNLLKLWRAVIKLGGYDKVTSCKLWRQVGESFNPPKTCTTVSWTFRIFYEKALLEFERDRLPAGELPLHAEPTRVENRADNSQTLGSGRALRDAAARAMQGWHSHRHLGNGEAGDAIIKEKQLSTMPKSDKQLRSSGLLKRKKSSLVDCDLQVADMKAIKPRLDTMVFDIGPPADWVKINVKRFHDCFEVYGLVPGLLREEVHVQSDPAGRLIISGQPTQLDNPWGVRPFKKVVSLPSRIDPLQTSAVVTLNGQLFVRVPVEQSDC